MAETMVSSAVESEGSAEGSADPPNRRRFTTAIVLFIVFIVLVALSVWLYPSRPDVKRPGPFSLTLSSASSRAFDTIPLAVVPNSANSPPSDVNVIVAPEGPHLYRLHVTWTYSPELCQTPDQSLSAGCAPSSPPFATAGSELSVSLPAGATILHCHSCLKLPAGALPTLAERDSQIQPLSVLPDASVYTATTPATPVTASWTFEVHATSFAWDANGLNAEASLPTVNFEDAGNVGYGNLTVRYVIPEGQTYDWSNGPNPDHLTWTEPVSSATTAVAVAGIDNSASASDTRDVLIVGILLGSAGGALVGAIQEIAHAESDGRGKRPR